MIKNINIDNGRDFDWGNASKDYAKYRDIYPDEFYQRITALGLCRKGQTALDLGTGTGVIPRNMYKFGADWTGADISENQIAQAKRLAMEENMNAAPAEKTNLPDNSFDVITACQCFMYFDKSLILPEIKRMLKQNGRLLILFMAWLPSESEIAYNSEKLVLKYNPQWTGGGFKRFKPEVPEGLDKWFYCVNNIAYDASLTFTRESWHGRMIACRGIGASSLPKEEIEKFKTEHWEYMKKLPETFSIPHYVTMLDLKKK